MLQKMSDFVFSVVLLQSLLAIREVWTVFISSSGMLVAIDGILSSPLQVLCIVMELKYRNGFMKYISFLH